MAANISLPSLLGLRTLFYLVSPNETTFEKVAEIPDYFRQALPWLIILTILEIFYSSYHSKQYYNLADTFTSFNAGMLSVMVKVWLYGFELNLVCWIYDNYGFRIFAWDSIWTWIITFVFVDFSYYWFHRAAHEINILWAFHQMHHNSQDYNLSTAFRQSIFQSFVEILFHIPESLLLPPSILWGHIVINKVNQVWVHTQVVKSIGPLEHILVSSSHHRVHHGRNPYCIDKNYSGTFIIWDKLFGTFQAEKPDEPIAYGLVHQPVSYNPFYLQYVYLKYIFYDKMLSMNSFGDKLKALCFGPGWSPGNPRLGNLSDVPKVEVSPRPVEPMTLRQFYQIALQVVTFTPTLFMYQTTVYYRKTMTMSGCIPYFAFMCFSIFCSSAHLDRKPYAQYLEILRAVVFYVMADKLIWAPSFMKYSLETFTPSFCILSILISLFIIVKDREYRYVDPELDERPLNEKDMKTTSLQKFRRLSRLAMDGGFFMKRF